MGLEEAMLGSSEIRNFLKLFSEQHWNKVTKAVMLVGIYRLGEIAERCGKNTAGLTITELEEIAVVAHKKAKRGGKRTRGRRHDRSEPCTEQNTA